MSDNVPDIRFFVCFYSELRALPAFSVQRRLKMNKDLLLHICYELSGDLANSSSPKCLKSGGKWCKVIEKG